MASKLWVSEHHQPPEYLGEMMPCVSKALRTQVVDFASGVTASSAAFGGDCSLVLIHADTACHISLASNPTAATTDMRLAAGADRYMWVKGETLKISVIGAV